MMSFRWLNKQGVESSDGFVFQRMDRFYYHYIRAGSLLKIIVEPGVNTEEISSESLNTLSPEMQTIVKRDIIQALDFMGIRHRFS
jgi:hypothetical protein